MPPIGWRGGQWRALHGPTVSFNIVETPAYVHLNAENGNFPLGHQSVVRHALVGTHQLERGRPMLLVGQVFIGVANAKS